MRSLVASQSVFYQGNYHPQLKHGIASGAQLPFEIRVQLAYWIKRDIYIYIYDFVYMFEEEVR
jgi:hypothetical protein